MTSDVRVLFALGARLHKSVAEIERLSTRELVGWVEFFTPEDEGDAVPDVHQLGRDELRAMFHHDSR